MIRSIILAVALASAASSFAQQVSTTCRQVGNTTYCDGQVQQPMQPYNFAGQLRFPTPPQSTTVHVVNDSGPGVFTMMRFRSEMEHQRQEREATAAYDAQHTPAAIAQDHAMHLAVLADTAAPNVRPVDAPADWAVAYANKDVAILIHPGSMVRNGQKTRAWVMTSYTTAYDAPSRTFQSMKGNDEFDCGNRTMRELSWTQYVGPFGQGDLWSVSTVGQAYPATDIAPDTLADRLLEAVCNAKTSQQSTSH